MKDCIVASAPMALVAADGRSGCSSLAALPKPASRDRQLTRCFQISLLPGFAGDCSRPETTNLLGQLCLCSES